MNETDVKLLEENGWIVECHSPLEIRHEESQCFANGYAANIILESVKKNKKRNDRNKNKEG